MNKLDVRYAAGMFDADGSVTISSYTYPNSSHTRYQVRTSMLSISPMVPERLAATFGGKVYYHDNRKRNPNWRPAYDWIAVSRAASDFIQQVLPHLINKREEAELAAALQHCIDTNRKRLGNCFYAEAPEREAIFSYRKSLMVQMQELKKRSYPLLDQAPNQLRVSKPISARSGALPSV